MSFPFSLLLVLLGLLPVAVWAEEPMADVSAQVVDEGWVNRWAEAESKDQFSLLVEEVRRNPQGCPALLAMIKAQQPQLAARALRIMVSTLGGMGEAQAEIARRLVAENPDLLIAAANMEPAGGEDMPDDLGIPAEQSAPENPQQLNVPVLSPAKPAGL